MEKVHETSGRYLFGEKQSFPKWIGWLMLSPVLITVGVTVAVSQNEKEEMWLALAIMVPIQFVLFWMFLKVKMETVVTSSGLYVRWLPLQKSYRFLDRKEIASYQLKKPPSTKYGTGRVPGYGKIYNMGDKEGIQMQLVNGKNIFFGTARTHDFFRAFQEMQPGVHRMNQRG